MAGLVRPRIGGRAWTVQAGVYEDRRLAHAAVTRLRAVGLPAETSMSLREQELAYTVQVGRYDRYEQALAQLPRVLAAQADAFVAVTR